MLKTNEVIIVEGKYDKNTLSQVVEAVVIPVSGFSLFNNREMQNFLKNLAKEKGIVVMTDSDSAGFMIRNFIKSSIPKDRLKHAYIPDVYGKERRKREASKEGKLGVEGMDPEVLVQSLRDAGVVFEDEDPKTSQKKEQVTKADLYALGITGKENSALIRKGIIQALGLPEHISTNGMLEVMNLLYSREEVIDLITVLTQYE